MIVAPFVREDDNIDEIKVEYMLDASVVCNTLGLVIIQS
jgi:hypothetical protein